MRDAFLYASFFCPTHLECVSSYEFLNEKTLLFACLSVLEYGVMANPLFNRYVAFGMKSA